MFCSFLFYEQQQLKIYNCAVLRLYFQTHKFVLRKPIIELLKVSTSLEIKK